MTEPLHRLPNGEWIDLTLVTRITTLPVAEPYRPTPVVTVFLNENNYIPLSFTDLPNAQTHADELAALVNEARKSTDG